MSGLLNQLSEFIKTPEGQGLLSGVFGYAANARRGTPINNLGRGGIAGLLGYSNAMEREQQAKDNAFQQEYRALQMDQLRQQAEQQKRQQAWRTQLPALMQPKLQGTDAVTNQIAAENAEFGDFGVQKLADLRTPLNISYGPDQNALQAHLMSPDSPFADKMLERQLFPKEAEAFTLGEGQVRYGSDGRIIAQGPAKQEATPADQRLYEYAKSQGFTGTLFDFKREIAKAGAARTTTINNVNTEKPFLNAVADGVGQDIVQSRGQAQAAATTIRTANRLLETLDSGRVLAGPATPAGRFMLQLADVFGVAGKDAKETLVKTRDAMQSLAQLELDAAQQMKGQGQITESERAILRKAASGDVDTMTVTELRTLAQTIDKVGRAKIQTYQQQIAPLMQNPNAAAVAPFLGVQMPAAYTPPSILRSQRQPSPAGGARFLGFEQ